MRVKVWLLMLLLGFGTVAVCMAADSVILEQGDNLIHGFAYLDGCLWASTRTSPCRILRIDAETLSYDRITLDAGLKDGEDLIAAEGYIWVILWMSPCVIVRVDPLTMEWEVALKIEGLYQGGSLEYAFGYLWAGGRSGKIARIDINDMSYQVYDYSQATGGHQFHAMTSGGGYIWGSAPAFVDSWFWGREYIGDTIVKIDPNDPASYSSVFIDDLIMSDDIAYADGHLYAGSESNPSYIYRFGDDLSYDRIRAGDTVCYGIFTYDGEIWGAFVGSPGWVARYDTALNLMAEYRLPSGFRNANEIAFDDDGDLYYVTCWDSPARIVKLERTEMRYAIRDTDERGGIVIPIEVFPEGGGAVIPIYVPPLFAGSNGIRNNGWETIREISRSQLSFQWEKALPTFSDADTPAGTAFSAIAGLISALNDAVSLSECKITIQRDTNGDLRAILSIGDTDRRTFLRDYAGDGWIDPAADSFWVVRAAFSDFLAETFDLPPDDFPDRYYAVQIKADPAHEDDTCAGYLSVSSDGVIMTPRIYPGDEMRIRRISEFIVPYRAETVMEFVGKGFLDLMEGPLPSGVIKTISYSQSDSVITVQGRSPVEIRVRDSRGRTTGMVNGQRREEIPNSLYHDGSKTAIIFSPADQYIYEIAGTGYGGYELEINSADGGNISTFTASISTLPGAIHEYAIEWDVLSQGGDGVTVRIDDDGDGTFERIIVSDRRLTQDEYSPVTAVTPDGLYPSAWGDVKRTVLLQNYPNPFNPETWIPYRLADDADVTVRIYSAGGQLIRTLDMGHRPAGMYTDRDKAVHWDGMNEYGEQAANGVYFYTISAGSFRSTKKMTIAR